CRLQTSIGFGCFRLRVKSCWRRARFSSRRLRWERKRRTTKQSTSRNERSMTALEKSVNEIIKRNEALRTTFITKGISKHSLRLLVRGARSAGYGAPAKNHRSEKWLDRLNAEFKRPSFWLPSAISWYAWGGE